ncbi:MAG: Gfo/Idh/MocA family oxidoreductase [Planctomycetaceae bacterium]
MANPVNIGVIGLGTAWETRYAPVLRKFRDRIHVRAIYDPLASRAEQVAALWSAVPVRGILSLLGRKDVRAIMLLDTAWHGPKTLELASSFKKPAYVAGRLGSDDQRLSQIYETARGDGITLMPEMSRRYAPSTVRLQELMATQLGRPQQIVIEAVRPAPETPPANENVDDRTEHDADFLVGLIDWCHYVVRTHVISVVMENAGAVRSAQPGEQMLSIEFAPARSQQKPISAELRIRDAAGASVLAGSSTEPATRYEIQCERGAATIESATGIAWQSQGRPIAETLTSDRADVEVLLDHFCRRVVGGLIPVADIGDICRGLEVVRAARQSLQTGQSVPFNGRL